MQGDSFIECITVTRIIEFIDPEDCVQFFMADIGDIMCMPDRYIHESGAGIGIDDKLDDPIGSYPTQLDAGLALDDDKTLEFSRMVMIPAGDLWSGRGKGNLPSALVQLEEFHKMAAVIDVGKQFTRKKRGIIDVGDKCIE